MKSNKTISSLQEISTKAFSTPYSFEEYKEGIVNLMKTWQANNSLIEKNIIGHVNIADINEDC